jgi:ketosteroid isomerase-like protein
MKLDSPTMSSALHIVFHDVVKVSEHKVVEFHQFVDTAAIKRLVARAHAAK